MTPERLREIPMTTKRRRPIAPSTEKLYRATLTRAGFPLGATWSGQLTDLSDWTAASMKTLRAAVTRFCPERLEELPDEKYEVARAIVPPTEAQLAAFEKVAKQYSPTASALMLLPLMLGLRAAEVLTLKREDVTRALTSGERLLVLRKGGREQLMLVTGGVRQLLKSLITVGSWSISWQLLSRTGQEAAYRTLHRLVRAAGERAGVPKLRPHKLRHGFASRMERAGASLPQIQKMMDHASPEMTMRYVHPEDKDIEQFLQGGKR